MPLSMPSAKPFVEVVHLLQQRSSTVLDVLVEQYGRRLFSYAYRNWGLTESEAEDVLFETFYLLILKVENLSFANQAQFDGYIYSTFSNKLHEQFRKKRKENRQELIDRSGLNSPSSEGDETALTVPFTEQDIAQEYESEVGADSPLIIRMQTALATLSTIDRDVLELWGQGYTYEEIGEVLHLDSKHLKVKCFRAKQKVMIWFAENKTL